MCCLHITPSLNLILIVQLQSILICGPCSPPLLPSWPSSPPLALQRPPSLRPRLATVPPSFPLLFPPPSLLAHTQSLIFGEALLMVCHRQPARPSSGRRRPDPHAYGRIYSSPRRICVVSASPLRGCFCYNGGSLAPPCCSTARDDDAGSCARTAQ